MTPDWNDPGSPWWENFFIAWIKCQNTSRSFHIFLAKFLLGTGKVIILAYWKGWKSISLSLLLKYSTSKMLRFQESLCTIPKKKYLKYINTLQNICGNLSVNNAYYTNVSVHNSCKNWPLRTIKEKFFMTS